MALGGALEDAADHGRGAVAGIQGARGSPERWCRGATSAGAADHESGAGARRQEGPSKRARASRTSEGPATEPPPPPPLPVDLQFEIVARSDDAATVLRCAAANKPLPALSSARNSAAASPFGPRRTAVSALLVAVSYLLRSPDSLTDHVVVQPSRRFRLATTLPLCPFEIAASSRDVLLLVVRRKQLRVCNTFTGHVTYLPCMDLRPAQDSRCIFWPALLTVDGAGRSFDLLAMDKLPSVVGELLRTRTFLLHKGEWGDVREVHLPLGYSQISSIDTFPVVIGRTVHWLCSSKTISLDNKMIILAPQADTAQAMAIEMPQGCLRSLESMLYDPAKGLIVATTGEGRALSLVVTEALVISMWTLPLDKGSSRWSRQVVIHRRDIDRQVTTGPLAYQRITFERFGERSGTVLFWMYMVGLVQLNLGTKKALVVWRNNNGDKIDGERALLHEIDLVSLLQGMTPF